MDGPRTKKRYPAHLRRVRYKDPDTGRKLVFLANRADVDALTVCALYKSRRHVELFFRAIKQNLKVKRFYGTSENAVKTQLRAAVSVYVLVAILRRQLGIEMPLSRVLQILSVTPFERMALTELLSPTDSAPDGGPATQLPLFPR